MQIPLLSAHSKIVLILLLTSALFYGFDYYFFGHAGDIAVGFLGNLAFLPIYVLFVTLMIERVLKERERIAIRQKLNMVIGVFFSEVGNPLLRDCLSFIRNEEILIATMKVDAGWEDADFSRSTSFLVKQDLVVDSRAGDLPQLKRFLVSRREFLLTLMGSPNLLEHEKFTDLLWAVFHLLEELEARRSLDVLTDADLDHLSFDIKRAYLLLLREWVAYLAHLKTDYPYLFSLAVRTNPLNPEARAEL